MSKVLFVVFNSPEAETAQGFASATGLAFDVLYVGSASGSPAGAGAVFHVPAAPAADSLAKPLAEHARTYSHVAAVSSMQSKDVMARVAGILDAAMVTDVISASGPTTFKRPIFAGSMISTVETLATPVVLTVRPAGFTKGAVQGGPAAQELSWTSEGTTKKVSENVHGSSRPDLSQAKIIVTGGRPLKDAETFEKVIGGLADKLGGGVGATRAAVDSGIAPNEAQVGQTGKIVAPDLYIAAGVSGSTQHMAGIKDSKIIVAINKDPDAPIFESADIGLVADLFDALPELQSKV